MSDFEQRIAQQTAEQAAHVAGMQTRLAEWQRISDERATVFTRLMRTRNIGTIALYQPQKHLDTTGGFWNSRRITAYSHEPLGRGWLVPGASQMYETTPGAWLVLDDEQQAPHVVACSPLITEAPPRYKKSPYGPPETPFVTIHDLGKSLADVTLERPFAHDQAYGWLTHAAGQYINQSSQQA